MVSSPILFLLANFGWKDEVLHLIISFKQYANYLSLYCPFTGTKKGQGANPLIYMVGAEGFELLARIKSWVGVWG